MSRSPVPGQEDFDDLPATIASGDAPSRASRATLIAGPSASSTGIAPLSPPNVFILVAALRRRFKLAMGLGPILAALAAVAAWNLVPTSKYTAKAQLQVSSTAPKVIFTTVENKVDFSTYQKTQLTLIKSKAVLNKALSDPEVAKLQDVRNQSDPSLWLERRIQADYLGEVLQISMSGDKPDDLAVLVNAVTDAYRREIVDVESKERWVRQEELQKIYNEYQANLEKRRGDMKKLATRIGSNDKQTIRYTQELAIERLATARRDLIGIQSDLRKFKAEYQIRMGHAEQEKARLVIPETTIQQYINEDAQVAQLKAKIGQLGASVGRVARVAKDATDPARLPLAADLAAHQKKLAAREAAVRSQAIEHLSRAATLEEVAALRGLRERIEVLDEQERVTREIVEAQSAENQEISQDTLYIDSIQDEIGHADSAAKRIGEELETLKVELRAPSRVKLLELADTPRKGDDKRAVITGMAGVGTFGLFLLGVAFVEFRARRISTIDEVTQSLGLRVVGSLPPNHEAYRRGLLGPRRSDPYAGNLMAESVDSLRTMLLHSTGDRAHRLIMVTSSTAGEGKTSLACHLATSLARVGDEDPPGRLRPPEAHHPPTLRPPGDSRVQRTPPRGDGPLRRDPTDDGRRPRHHFRRGLRPLDPQDPLEGVDGCDLRPDSRGLRHRHPRHVADPARDRCPAHRPACRRGDLLDPPRREPAPLDFRGARTAPGDEDPGPRRGRDRRPLAALRDLLLEGLHSTGERAFVIGPASLVDDRRGPPRVAFDFPARNSLAR